jgi:hypothetical protein
MTGRTASPNDALRRVQIVARVLDDAIRIPGTNFRIGIDPLVGLMPGGGDLLGGVASLYILLEAARAGAPPSVLLRMAANVLIDTVIGAIPVLGDAFDFGWKSNTRNARLLARHIESPVSTRRASTALLIGVLVGLVAAGVGVAVLVVIILRHLLH